MNRPKKKTALCWILAVIVLLLLLAGALKLRSVRIHQNDSIADAGMQPWAVRVEPVSEHPLASAFPVLATALTSEEITLACRIAGEILEMGPREGQSVKKNDLLARIDIREIEQQILSQQAKLEAAKADLVNKSDQYKRLKSVLDRGGTSVTDVEAAQTAVLSAEYTVESLTRLVEALKIRRGYGEIRSPSDGVIAARLAEPGNTCAPAQAIYRITVTLGARVRVSLPQNIIGQLHPGSTLVLYHDSDTMNVSLSRIFPSLDAHALGSAEADIETPPYGLKSGARVPGKVLLEERKNALVVPHEALLVSASDPTKGTVFVVMPAEHPSGGEAARVIRTVPVSIDLDAPEGIAVLGDLKDGDPLVVAHEIVLRKLHDGDPVDVIAPKR